MIIIDIIVIVAVIMSLACVVPFTQYLYCHVVKKEQYSLRYYFSSETFDRHLKYDVGLNDTRVIHNRTEMDSLWDAEMAHRMP